MVAAVRRGAPLRAAARQFRVSLSTLQRWVARAEGKRLDRVDWGDRPAGPRHAPRRTARALEDLVLSVRRELREASDLGEYGAAAIRRELLARGAGPVPAVRTINRILERRGAFDARRRVRRKPPPRGWYLPDLAAAQVDLDEFDIVCGLVIKGGPQVEVLTAIALHGGAIEAWPDTAQTAATARAALVAHWRARGLPGYAQFDNDTRFQGPHQHPDVLGSVSRLCLSLGVVPAFAPPRETGFQAAIESLNGRWQAKVWARFQHESLAALQARSAGYVAACRVRGAVRLEGAPARRPFPADWRLDLRARPRGRLIYLRRTTARGEAELLGRSFAVDALWPHRLVRCEVDLDAAVIRFYALRRRDPEHQPLLNEVPYVLPQRRYRG
jgi:Homeodomain-like domain